MPWPPVALPITRANDTPQIDNHPADHNALAAAVNLLVRKLRLPAPGEIIGGGATFGGTYVNLVSANVPAPPDADSYPCAIHVIGSAQFFPRNTGFVQAAFQVLAGTTEGTQQTIFLPAGTAQPAHVANGPTVFASLRLTAPPAGAVVPLALRAASSDGVTYPTSGGCVMVWHWTPCD